MFWATLGNLPPHAPASFVAETLGWGCESRLATAVRRRHHGPTCGRRPEQYEPAPLERCTQMENVLIPTILQQSYDMSDRRRSLSASLEAMRPVRSVSKSLWASLRTKSHVSWIITTKIHTQSQTYSIIREPATTTVQVVSTKGNALKKWMGCIIA